METALERIEADWARAVKEAERLEKRGEEYKAWRALGVADGLRAAAGYLRAERATPQPQEPSNG
jgi:hypothetical protein